MLEIKVYGVLKIDCPFASIFPERRVPLKSFAPVTPAGENAPLCFVLDPDRMTMPQINEMSKHLHSQNPIQCPSLEIATKYVINGLPLNIEWFCGRGA